MIKVIFVVVLLITSLEVFNLKLYNQCKLKNPTQIESCMGENAKHIIRKD